MPLALSQADRLAIHSHLKSIFPALTLDNYEIESPLTPRYNCIAMAADDVTRRWWPTDLSHPTGREFYWPQKKREQNLECFVHAFAELGYEVCENDSYERGFEKVAIYINHRGTPTHMAKQLRDGVWCSKLGVRGWDILHETPQVLHSREYGHVAQVMKRRIQ